MIGFDYRTGHQKFEVGFDRIVGKDSHLGFQFSKLNDVIQNSIFNSQHMMRITINDKDVRVFLILAMRACSCPTF